MKKFLATMLALVMALALCTTAWADSVFTEGTATVTDVDGLKVALTEIANGTITGDLVINVEGDIDFAGSGWTAIYYNTAVNLTINGNDHTFKNLPDALFDFGRTLSAPGSLTIKDLTVQDPAVSGKGANTGAAALVNYVEISLNPANGEWALTLENCAVHNPTISGGDWNGGLIGAAAATNGNMKITIKDCSVVGGTISDATFNDGSSGGIMGHAIQGNGIAISVTGTTVSGVTITSGNSSKQKAGALFGTASSDNLDASTSITVAATVSNNTVKYGGAEGTAVPTIYGRGYSSNVEITGGSYDNEPISSIDDWAEISDTVSVATVSDADNKVVSYVYGDAYIQDAAEKATSGQTITITSTGNSSTLALTDVPSGVTIVVDGANVTVNGTIVTEKYTVPTATSGGSVYYYSTTTSTTDTGKSSPKTFDAGVAMYVGMAVMSVTGMAYVGKKKF